MVVPGIPPYGNEVHPVSAVVTVRRRAAAPLIEPIMENENRKLLSGY